MNNAIYFYTKKINIDESTVCILNIFYLFTVINIISDMHLLQSAISSNISHIWND